MLPRRVHCQFFLDDIIDQPVEAAAQLEQLDEAVGAYDLVIDADEIGGHDEDSSRKKTKETFAQGTSSTVIRSFAFVQADKRA
jgi:hypothetical protein